MKLGRVVSVICVLFSMAMANKPHRRYFGLHKDQPLDEINDRISFQYESTKGPETSTSNVNMGRIKSTFPEDFPDPTTEAISTNTNSTVANLYTSTLAGVTTIPVGGLKHNIDENNISVESTENNTNMKSNDTENKLSNIQETLRNQSKIEVSLKGENVKDLIDEVASNTSVNIKKPGLNSRFGYNTDYILTPVATIQNGNLNVPAPANNLNNNGVNYNQNLPNAVLLSNLGQGNPDAIKFPSDTPTDITNNPYPGNLNSGYVNSLPSAQTNQVINNNPGYSTAMNNLQTVPISFGSNQIQAVPVMGFLQNTGINNQGYTNMPNNGYNQITFPNSNAQIVNNDIVYPNNNNNYVATNYPQNLNYQQFTPPVVNNGQSNIVSNNGQLFQLLNVPGNNNNNFNDPNVQSNNYYVPNTQNQFVNSQPINTMQPGLNNNIVTFNNQNYQLVPLQAVGSNVANNPIPIMSNPHNVNYVGAGQSQVDIPNNGQILNNNNNQMLLVNNG